MQYFLCEKLVFFIFHKKNTVFPTFSLRFRQLFLIFFTLFGRIFTNDFFTQKLIVKLSLGLTREMKRNSTAKTYEEVQYMKLLQKSNKTTDSRGTPPKKTFKAPKASKKDKLENKKATSKKKTSGKVLHLGFLKIGNKSATSVQKMKEIPLFLRIKTKLIASFGVTIFCIIFLGVMSYSRSSQGITSNYEESAGQTMEMIVQYLDLAFNNVQSNYKPYLNTQDLDYYFKGMYAKDNAKQTTTYNAYKASFNKMVTSDPLVSNFYLIADSVESFSTSLSQEKKLYSIYTEQDYGKEVAANPYTFFWYGIQPEVDSALNTSSEKYGIRLARHLQGSKTIMIVDIKREVLLESLSSLNAGEDSVVGLVTQDGKELLSNEAFHEDQTPVFTTTDFYQKALEAEEESGAMDVKDNGKAYLFLYHKMVNQGAMVCTLIPKSYILSQVQGIRNVTIVLVIISSLLAIILGTVIASGMESAIGNITHQLRKISKGDLTAEVKTRRKDEFKLLAQGINDMTASMKALIENVNSVSEQLNHAAVLVSDTSATFMQTSQDIQYAISDIESGVNQLDTDSADCLAQMDSLSGKISTVSETTANIEQLTSQTTVSIQNGMNSMNGLNESAMATSQITNKVIVSIEELEERSRSIGHIVDAINNIAEETNLLSLNASIEAARAGEAGRGFCVVAEEIRKLADQSLNSANEIGRIIQQMISQTHDVVETARQAEVIVDTQKTAVTTTTTSFDDMSQQITNLMDSLSTITDDVNGMGVSRDTTLSAIESISSISEETSAASSNVADTAVRQMESATELAKASSDLAARANQLSDLLKQFIL